MGTPRPENRQVAPFPDELADLVDKLRYRRHLNWNVRLIDNYQRDTPGQHTGEARGLTLVIQRCGPNSYNLDEPMVVNHLFAVPAATYNRQSWLKWLFDRLGDVDAHERMEDFVFEDGSRPFAPCHGPGWDPYLLTVERTEQDRRMSFRGELNPG